MNRTPCSVLWCPLPPSFSNAVIFPIVLCLLFLPSSLPLVPVRTTAGGCPLSSFFLKKKNSKTVWIAVIHVLSLFLCPENLTFYFSNRLDLSKEIPHVFSEWSMDLCKYSSVPPVWGWYTYRNYKNCFGLSNLVSRKYFELCIICIAVSCPMFWNLDTPLLLLRSEGHVFSMKLDDPLKLCLGIQIKAYYRWHSGTPCISGHLEMFLLWEGPSSL